MSGPKETCIRYQWTKGPPGKYHWTVHVWQQCSLLSNHFDHLLYPPQLYGKITYYHIHPQHCSLMEWIPTQQQQPFYGRLSGTTRVSRYQKKHSPTHHSDHHPIFISFFHLPWSIASSLFKLHALQSFCTTSVHALFGLSLGLEPYTSYSIHFFTPSVSSFRNTCPYHCNLEWIPKTLLFWSTCLQKFWSFTHNHKLMSDCVEVNFI